MKCLAIAVWLVALTGCPAGTGSSVKHENLVGDGDACSADDEVNDRRKGKTGDDMFDKDLGGLNVAEAPAPEVPAPDEPQVASSQLELSDEALASAVAPRIVAAEAAVANEDWDTVVTEARAALLIDGSHVGAVLLLARAYYHKQWYTKARAIAAQATGAKPGSGSAELWMLRGLVAEALDAPLDEVAGYYTEAVRLRPKYARAWTNLGAVHIARNEYADAIAALKTALSQQPDLVSAHTNLGTAYRRQGMRAKPEDRDQLLIDAEESYNAAIRADETYAPAHLNLGILYLDSEPFPGKDDIERLRAAVKSLTDYKALAGSGQTAGAEYLSAAQRQLRSYVTNKKRNSKK